MLIQNLGVVCKIEDLSNETLLSIFDYLDRKDLRAVRLVCHQFLHSGDTLLYQVVYFSPRRPSMWALSNISQHEFFKKTVKHVIYDDTQLVRALINWKVFHPALPSSASDAEARRAFNLYRQLFDEQESILRNGEDILVLRNALACLPNLEKISVTGGPSRHPRGGTYFQEGAQAQRFASTLYGLSYWSYHDSDEERYQFWDRRPFHHLLKALESAKVQLKDLHIGNTWNSITAEPIRMGIPLSSLRDVDFFDNRNFLTVCKNAFAHLTSLDLQIDVHGRALGHEYYDGDMDNLFEILPFTKRLTSLSLGFTNFCLHADDTLNVLVNKWPALHSVRFRNMEVTVVDLLDFFETHKATLKNLVLHDFGLHAGSDHDWMQLAKRARELLRFSRADVRVYELIDDDDDDALDNRLFQWGRPLTAELTRWV